MNIKIPYQLEQFIDSVRGKRSRIAYMFKCVDYVKREGIDITSYYNDIEDYEAKRTNDTDKGSEQRRKS